MTHTEDSLMALADDYGREIADCPNMPTPVERKLCAAKIERARDALRLAIREVLAEPGSVVAAVLVDTFPTDSVDQRSVRMIKWPELPDLYWLSAENRKSANERIEVYGRACAKAALEAAARDLAKYSSTYNGADKVVRRLIEELP